MLTSPTIVWFRQDLRVQDHLALIAAAKTGPIVPIFILDESDPWHYGAAAKWWLHQSLSALNESLNKLGTRLILRRGKALAVLLDLISETGAKAVFWGRCYEPWVIERDKKIKEALLASDIRAESFNHSLLFEPWQVQNQQGLPFRVYTPFSRACFSHAQQPPAPLPAPDHLIDACEKLGSDRLDDWPLKPIKPNWAAAWPLLWQSGSEGAAASLERFLQGAVHGYKEGRNIPGALTTSRLSPYLHHGEISPRQVWHAVRQMQDGFGGAHAASPPAAEDSGHFLKELLWREFSYHLLYHFPDLPVAPFNKAYENFPWAEDADSLKRWQRGLTGYPIVDAGMRELWQTGWMHNRVRMIVASFLIKDLLIPWQEGAKWFWDTLLDADLANNSASWQWVAGSGADAAPYFRVFNPTLQGKKFDTDGSYVRRFVPELAKLPDAYLHTPWEAPEAVLSIAGVTLGTTYPSRMIEHDFARDRALAALAQIKKSPDAAFGADTNFPSKA